ncbi:hypothetical protein NDU88_002884 [Pleurodeles waltl]|uniref:Uncharacterized protein n=1 Tax=Pleurodeles waltl TaxID=8319 RepID=A0AAV7NJ13_PLEWA|nr:hypothetical protein NDU88_002884 [Pleurodeles waltl]
MRGSWSAAPLHGAERRGTAFADREERIINRGVYCATATAATQVLKNTVGLSGGTELSAQSSKTLKWDYSGTNLRGSAKVPTPDVQFKADRSADVRVGCPDLSIGTTSTDSKMLQSIYDLIKELQTETRVESRWARIATKRLQETVRKVVKSCIEIEEKLNTMEERTMLVEADVEPLREQSVAHDGQLTDIMRIRRGGITYAF